MFGASGSPPACSSDRSYDARAFICHHQPCGNCKALDVIRVVIGCSISYTGLSSPSYLSSIEQTTSGCPIAGPTLFLMSLRFHSFGYSTLLYFEADIPIYLKTVNYTFK